MDELDVDFVDILDVNEEGLLFNDEGVNKIAEKFKKEKLMGYLSPTKTLEMSGRSRV